MTQAHYDEGVIKFRCAHRTLPLGEKALETFAPINAWREIFMRLGIVGADPGRYGGAGFGNLSARLPPFPGERHKRRFVITGTQTAKARDFGARHLCVIESYELKENAVASSGPVEPSSESMTHGTLYNLNPNIRYVFHAHAPLIWQRAGEMRLPTTNPKVAYGTPEMAFEAARLYRESDLSERRIMAMGGHEDGIITFGRNAAEAGNTMVDALARALEMG